MELLFQKRLGSLIPADEASEAALSKVGQGDIVKIKGLVRPRNIKFHRLFFAMLNLVADNTELVEDVDQLLYLLKISTGHVRKFIDKNGRVLYEPRSISFASMSADEFSKFYDRCVEIVCERVIPGMDSEALKAEIYEMVGT